MFFFFFLVQTTRLVQCRVDLIKKAILLIFDYIYGVSYHRNYMILSHPLGEKTTERFDLTKKNLLGQIERIKTWVFLWLFDRTHLVNLNFNIFHWNWILFQIKIFHFSKIFLSNYDFLQNTNIINIYKIYTWSK